MLWKGLLIGVRQGCMMGTVRGVRCTVRGVWWYGTGGTVVRCEGYEGTVQGVMVVRVVPWSGPRAAVVQYTTGILWCGARGEVVYGAGCI